MALFFVLLPRYEEVLDLATIGVGVRDGRVARERGENGSPDPGTIFPLGGGDYFHSFICRSEGGQLFHQPVF